MCLIGVFFSTIDYVNVRLARSPRFHFAREFPRSNVIPRDLYLGFRETLLLLFSVRETPHDIILYTRITRITSQNAHLLNTHIKH